MTTRTTGKAAVRYRVVCSEYQSDPFTGLERARRFAGRTEQTGMCAASHHEIQVWTGTSWRPVESSASVAIEVLPASPTGDERVDPTDSVIHCAWCGDVDRTPDRLEAYRLAGEHWSWHARYATTQPT